MYAKVVETGWSALGRRSLLDDRSFKVQWHADVWDAATGQRDLQYLTDWRSEQRGIYCVLWFEDLPSATNRRLNAHPDGVAAPATADAMRALLVGRIPESRRPLFEIFVLDLTAGRPA